MREALRRLIELQRLYTEREETRESLDALPARRAGEDRRFEAFEGALRAFTDRITALRKGIRSAEIDIEALEENRAKYESQLLAVKTNEAYKALIAEIDGVKQKVGAVEEKILGMMEEEEGARREAESKKKEEPAVKALHEAALGEIASEEQSLRVRRAELDAAWEGAVRAVSPRDLDTFMRLIEGRQGVAVSRIVGEDCEACAMLVRPHLIQQVKTMSLDAETEEDVLLCENCSRILYWAEDTGAAPPSP